MVEDMANNKDLTHWLISSNPKIYNAVKAFQENKQVDWQNSSNNKMKNGDVVHIYITSPININIINMILNVIIYNTFPSYFCKSLLSNLTCIIKCNTFKLKFILQMLVFRFFHINIIYPKTFILSYIIA